VAFLPLDARSGQIVVTVGPASYALGGELAEAGATAFRLNASHLLPDELRRAASTLRTAARDCPIVVDLQGAKMRLGDFAARRVHRREVVLFVCSATGPGIGLPHPELFRSVHPGETLSIDDGRLRLCVLDVGPDTLRAECLSDGLLRARKGVNVVEHPVDLTDLSASDAAHVGAMGAAAGVAFAFSFAATGAEAGWVRRRAPGCPIIGKVERAEACENLAAIGDANDAIWICRGDLGAQLGARRLATFVAALRPRQIPVPVLMAGQVLEQLTRGEQPTRSEVCHLFDLLERGYAGIVLSDETAIGDDPVGATRAAAALVRDLSG
jgi:pyruvate kinase